MAADYLVAERETLEPEKRGKKERCKKDGKTGQMKNMHREACRGDLTTERTATEAFHGVVQKFDMMEEKERCLKSYKGKVE